MNNKIETLINKFMVNHNNTDINELKNLVTSKDYLDIYVMITNIMNEFNTFDESIIKDELIKRSGIFNDIKDIVYKKELTKGLTINFGTRNSRVNLTTGYKSIYSMINNKKTEDYKELGHNNIFDLASTSKFFTSLAIYILKDSNLIDFYKPITEYLPRYINLSSVTVYDLLKFNTTIKTTKRIDNAHELSRSHIKNLELLHNNMLLLNNMYIDKKVDNMYTDMGAMILKELVEKITGQSFNNFINDTILNPYNMNNTSLIVDSKKLDLAVSNNFAKTVNKDGIINENTDIRLGVNFDPKARIFKVIHNNAPGHAGYFSTPDDMIKLASVLSENKILSKESLYDISQNITGDEINLHGEISYTKYYGSLVYSKQPKPNGLAVHNLLSGRSILSPGFTGISFVVDPLNDLSIFFGSNRLHDGIYQIPSNLVETNEFGKKTYKGYSVVSSFANEKEIIIDKAVKLSLAFKMIEELSYSKNNYLYQRKISN